MAYLLDILGSFAVGALVMLMLFRFNQTMLSASNEKLLYNISQLNTVVASEVIEYDFYKIGYRVPDTTAVFLDCDDDGITYLSDVNNDGVVDTVEYYLSELKELEKTTNPKDRNLYRRVNKGVPEIITPLINFELGYRDTNGVAITPVSELSDAKKREAIRGIDVYILLESADPINNLYQGTEWSRNIALKNVF
jgi:hypothetical protein